MKPHEETADFLHTLYPDGLPADQVISIWSLRSRITAHIPFDQVCTHTDTWRKRGHEIYYGVCSRQAGLADTTRGKVRHCRTVPGFWLDIDLHAPEAHKTQETLPPTRDEALQILEAGPLPTAIVDSGFGLHVYWLFDKPITLAESETAIWSAHAKEFQRRYIEYARTKHQWHVDSTGSLDRILRLPGTLNHKGSTPKPVTALFTNGPRYAPTALIPTAKMGVSSLFSEQERARRFSQPSGLSQAVNALADPRTTQELHRALGDHIAAGWGRPETRALLAHVYRGEMYATAERDTNLQRIASALAFMFPHADPAALTALLDPSLRHHEDQDQGRFTQDDRLEWAHKKIVAALQDKAAKDAQEAAQAADFAAGALGYLPPDTADIPPVFAPPSPTTPRMFPTEPLYTPQDVYAFAVSQGCATPAAFCQQWIVQVGDFFYVYRDGAYAPGIKFRGLDHSVQPTTQNYPRAGGRIRLCRYQHHRRAGAAYQCVRP
jgi:hypothetical protein